MTKGIKIPKSVKIASYHVPTTYLFISVLILVLVAASGIIKLPLAAVPLTGYTVFNIGQTSYSTGNGNFAQYFTTNIGLTHQGSDLLTGAYSESIKDTDASADGVVSNKSFTIGLKLNKASCDYPVSHTVANTLGPVKLTYTAPYTFDQGGVGGMSQDTACLAEGIYWQVQYVDLANSPSSIRCYKLGDGCADDFARWCTANAGYKITECNSDVQQLVGSSTKLGRACVKIQNPSPDQAYYNVFIGTGEVARAWNITVTQTVQGNPSESVTLDSNTGATVGNAKHFTVEFTGSVFSNNLDCPSGESMVVLQATSPGDTINVVNIRGAVLYDQYNNIKPYKNNFIAVADQTMPNTQTLIDRASAYNNNIGILGTQIKTDVKYDNVKGMITKDVTGAPPTFQQFHIITDALWLGVTRPTVDPKITSLTPSITFAAAGSGSGQITVHNNAAYGGGVTITTTCPGIIWNQEVGSWYNTDQTKSGTFTMSSGTVTSNSQCCFTASSGTPVIGGLVNSDTKCLQYTVTPQCNINCPYPKVRDPAVPCGCKCAINCDVNTVLNNNTCTCDPIPPYQKCSDGTTKGQCNYNTGKLCRTDGTLVDDNTCKMCTGNIPFNQCFGNQRCVSLNGLLTFVDDATCPTCNGQYQHQTNAGCITCAPPKTWDSTNLLCNDGNDNGDDMWLYIIIGLVIVGAGLYIANEKEWI